MNATKAGAEPGAQACDENDDDDDDDFLPSPFLILLLMIMAELNVCQVLLLIVNHHCCCASSWYGSFCHCRQKFPFSSTTSPFAMPTSHSVLPP